MLSRKPLVDVLEVLETASGLRKRMAEQEDGDEEAKEQRDNLTVLKRMASDPDAWETQEIQLPVKKGGRRRRKKLAAAAAAEITATRGGIDNILVFLNNVALMSDFEDLKDKVCSLLPGYQDHQPLLIIYSDHFRNPCRKCLRMPLIMRIRLP